MSGAHAGGPTVAIVGVTGYAGSELARWLLAHPVADLRTVVARNRAGRALGEVVPALLGATDLVVSEFDPALVAAHDFVLLATPHGVAKELVPVLQEAGARRILDLSSDHRAHPEWTYGLADWNAEAIASADRIAVPGCFATAIELAVAPLVAAHAHRGPIHVTGATGSTGSGANPSAGTHHPERFANLRAYKVLSHQHVPEVVRFLGGLGPPPEIRFVPMSAPLDRGILVAAQAEVDPAADLPALVAEAYKGRPLVRMRTDSPEVRLVRGTAYADLAVHQDGAAGVVLCAIDNLGKGAAAQAIQCLNLVLGLPDHTGLGGASCTP